MSSVWLRLGHLFQPPLGSHDLDSCQNPNYFSLVQFKRKLKNPVDACRGERGQCPQLAAVINAVLADGSNSKAIQYCGFVDILSIPEILK